MTAPRPTAVRRIVALAACLTLVTTACMFNDDDDSSKGSGANIGFDPVESGLPSDAKPKRGGKVVYGLEAETGASMNGVGTGWCMPEAQLAISGLQVGRALFDPLVVPDADGNYVPYLAKAVQATDDTFEEWTITVRPGVEFHDGTPLTSEVLANNLEAYRGNYPGRSSLLFTIVFENIESVTATNETTVTVKMKKPWVAFDAALYSSGRVLIVAQAQLDDQKTCATKPIGTGPFKDPGNGWTPNVSFKLEKNPNYWQIAPDEERYPYLDAIEFRPIPNSDARLTALQQGDINMMHTSNVADMADNLSELRDAGEINLMTSEERTEANYLMFNVAKPELSDLEVRRAVALAIDRDEINKINNSGAATLANGPFAPEVLGYLEDPGAPKFDLDAAKKAVATLKKAGEPMNFELLTTSGPDTIRLAGILKQQMEAAGIGVTLVVTTQSDLINRAISGNYQIATFRNQPGDDPDSNHHWWTGKSALNFGNFEDQEITDNLAKGRVSTDQETRREAYEAISKRLVSQVYNYYLWFSPWAVAEASNVHGIIGPELPSEGGEPPARLVTGHPLLGVWIDQ